MAVVCILQTGTLTEDGLDLYGVIPARNRQLRQLVTNVGEATATDLPANFVEAMATCHSLTLINDVISGDPLDVKVRRSTLPFCCNIDLYINFGTLESARRVPKLIVHTLVPALE